jgi:hypothetical protein
VVDTNRLGLGLGVDCGLDGIGALQISDKKIDLGGWSVPLFNSVLSMVLCVMMIFIVIKLHVSYMRLQVWLVSWCLMV